MMQLLPLSVQFNRATKRPDFAKIEGSLAFVNFIRNNLEVRSRIKYWDQIYTHDLVACAIALLEKQKFKRLRTWIYDRLHPSKKPGAIMEALLLNEADYSDVRVGKGTIEYFKNNVLVKKFRWETLGLKKNF